MKKNELLLNSQNGLIKSFGINNPDKVFFVIRQEKLGRGLFSLLSSVLCYIDFAHRNGLTPVVDFENFRTEYNESTEINEMKNSFEYYFKQRNKITLNEVYSSKFVIFSDNEYALNYSYSVTNIPGILNLFHKYFEIDSSILNESKLSSIFPIEDEKKILGVHFRGQEFRTAQGHWYPPSKKQIVHSIDLILKKSNCVKIFVSTEDVKLLRFIESVYGSIVSCHNNFRTDGVNAYKINPRQNHRYLLGREIMVDMLTLSSCNSFIGCTSNVAEMARLFNNNNYSCQIKINNGPNSWRYPISKVSWKIKNIMPYCLGGFEFSEDVIIFKGET
jgi:hypothetical protein